MKTFDTIVSTRNSGDYQRDNFDKFLKNIGFKYNIKTIHIAGTNGKGSTLAYIASIYQKAGYKVGAFYSPSINDEFNDMININNEAISDKEISEIVSNYKKQINRFELSNFEILTFVALTYFQKCNVDIAIVECGMGGAYDATNIFDPVLSIITSISLEHTAFLGKSITEIAEHKAGIIKYEKPTLISHIDEEAKDVIIKTCIDNKSHLYEIATAHNIVSTINGTTFDYLTFNNIFIPSIANYSVNDACLAIEATIILNELFNIDVNDIYNGLKNCIIPCRMEKVCDSPVVIIDGAHNPEAIDFLCDSINKIFKNQTIHVVFACFKDKNLNSMLAKLGELGDINLTTFDHPRSRTYIDYFLYAEEYHFEEDYQKLIANLIEKYPNDIILVTGSFAFASLVRKTIFK